LKEVGVVEVFNWSRHLEKINNRLLFDAQGPSDFCLPDEVYEDIIRGQWLGRPGADDALIRETEARLGVSLPCDFREFVRVSNGWWGCTMFPCGLAAVMPLRDVCWTRDSAWAAEVERFQNDMRPVFPPVVLISETLLIGAGDGNDFIFLHPSDGEVLCWEREVGATRFKSFQALMCSL
jgi:SMI1 / KNR4 family (SUKH-1)